MMCRRPAQCVDRGFGPESCRLCKPRHLRRKADRLPAIDPAEAFRVYMHGAKLALAAAENSTGLERYLNLETAKRQVGVALMLRLRGAQQ